jgi:hypothetical protein
MQQGYLLKTVSIVGFILVVSGIGTLLFYVAPIRLLADAVEPHETSLVPGILGGLALIGGIALLFATRPRG